MSQRKIAKKLGLSRNTVKKYLEKPELCESGGRTRKRKSLLDPYVDNLKAWLEEDEDYTAVWIYDHLTAMGFTVRPFGTGFTVRPFVHKFKG